MADSRKSGKWRAVMKKPAVRHTLKAVSAVFKCLMTILLIGVITATMVGCVMVVYVMINFKDNDGIPTELGHHHRGGAERQGRMGSVPAAQGYQQHLGGRG